MFVKCSKMMQTVCLLSCCHIVAIVWINAPVVEKIFMFLRSDLYLKFFLLLRYQVSLVPDFKAILNYCTKHMSSRRTSLLPSSMLSSLHFQSWVLSSSCLLSPFCSHPSSSPLSFLSFHLSSLPSCYPCFLPLFSLLLIHHFSSFKTNEFPGKLLDGFMHIFHLCIALSQLRYSHCAN